jgi:hypothetical protein
VRQPGADRLAREARTPAESRYFRWTTFATCHPGNG